jgi:hypothetical protein
MKLAHAQYCNIGLWYCDRTIALLLGDSVTFKNAPIVKTQMLIHKPVEDAFEVFVNPAITMKFRFTEPDFPLIRVAACGIWRKGRDDLDLGQRLKSGFNSH